MPGNQKPSREHTNLEKISSGAEINRLLRKLTEDIKTFHFLNAIFDCTLLSMHLQKRFGSLRWRERTEEKPEDKKS